MRHINLLLMVFVLLPILGWSALSTSFSPKSVEVNAMSTISFDPQEPLSQPPLTNLTITWNGSTGTLIYLKLAIFWNQNPLLEKEFISKNVWTPPKTVILSNRDLISNQDNDEFQPIGNSISVDDVINANPLLKSAVMAGYFPDGNLVLRISVDTSANFTSEFLQSDTFTIKVRNAGAIYLLSPGVAIGQNPPQISQRPLSFQWNSVSTGFNKSSLIVREYPANNPPSQNNIENTGNLFYSNPDVSSGFSDFLAFNPGNYYAWQITTTLFNEFTIQNQNLQPKLKSNWFVFRYVNESQNTNETAAEMQAQLNILNNNALRSILAQGYTLVGTVIYEGRTYSGQDALDLLSGLAGKELQVQLRD